jgi:uncharacterized membrane protein YecN with MAPEG domain
MELPNISLLSITPIYIAILGLMFVPLTLRVGLYRLRNQVDIGDAGDAGLLRMIRCQANFVETTPLAVALLIVMELMGAENIWLHALGATLVAGRMLHFLGFSGIGPFIGRPAGMVATFTVYVVSSAWILAAVFG